MIQAKNISRFYGDLQVLKGIDISIKPSEVVSITGASGAGKTTLLQILGTLDKPNTGEVLINGQDIFSLKEQKLADFRNQHIGFVFQFHHLLPEFSCLENVCIPGFIGKRKVADVEKQARELLAYLKMDHRMDHKPSELSGGE
ncbi:MAG: ATP-binding cassette domain-containing protein, partial [Bacteroidales bacterium]|nr:ATP-binding cassette domain-containing protein [Bacteroidales bacterium]